MLVDSENDVKVQAGLDSLAAVELRNAVAAAFSIDVPATITFDYPTLKALGSYVAAQVAPTEAPAASHAALQVRCCATFAAVMQPAHKVDLALSGSWTALRQR